MIQGMSGLMSITGQPDGEPQRVGVAVTDLFSGLYAVIGILAALRDRDRTGRGQHPRHRASGLRHGDARQPGDELLRDRQAPGRTGNGHPNIVPYQVFPWPTAR
jgi:crotonobetainyl-CoA:carnitine CoA-transferase CaiB-like acyl-CoA transferase